MTIYADCLGFRSDLKHQIEYTQDGIHSTKVELEDCQEHEKRLERKVQALDSRVDSVYYSEQNLESNFRAEQYRKGK
jgi:peptidoglycan hydrolase CwlO-like protein